MLPKHRTLVTAILATIGTIAFFISLAALIPNVMGSLGATHGEGIGVNYTFEENRCVGGTSQFRDCAWFGQVETPADIVGQDNVAWGDPPPGDVLRGLTVPALWDPAHPSVAYDLESSHAWMTSLASAIVSGVLGLIMLATTIIWWRKFAREGNERRKLAARNQSKHPRPDSTAADKAEAVEAS